MEALRDLDPLQEDVDLVYQILKAGGQPQKFRDLVQQVFTLKNIPLDNHQLMAFMHTQLNLDSRFVFLGQGTWGLKLWTKDKVVIREISSSDLEPVPSRRRRSLEDELEADTGDYQSREVDLAADDDDWDE